MKNNILDIIRNKQFQKRLLLFVAALVVGLVLILPRSLAVENQAVKSVVIPSEKLDFEEKQAGAWKITESTKWTGKGEAEITFDLETVFRNNLEGTDFIFALDTSSSMSGDKLVGLKNSIKKFSEDLLNDPSNKISIINFNSDANLLVDFTDDKNLVSEKVDSLVAIGKTNYYNALVKVNEVLKNYQVEENRNCVVVFIAGSYPTEGSPNQDTYFKYLKEEYSNVVFNAVQYELGDKISEQVKNISDNQYLASSKNLSDKLVKFLDVSEVYDEFSISEYINDKYFNVGDIKEISVNKGTVNLDKSSQKITWNIDNLKSGLGAKMEVNINLKNEFLSQYDLYSVSKRIEVNSLIGEDREEVNNLTTPILSNNHKVIYDGNAPDGCSPSNIPSALNKSVFDVVTIADMKPTCKGYQFKGWKIVTDSVEKVNSEHFVMPDEDVIIRAEWSKIKVSTSTSGKVLGKATLYKVLQDEAEQGRYAKEYTGAHQDSMSGNGNQKIYHFYAANETEGASILNKNNVIFAGHCWQMIRTTDTGGVKMLYNGEAVDNKCLSTRGAHVGYRALVSDNLTFNYWYGTDYTYDETTKKFKLSGTTKQAMWSDATYQNLLGKYTCKLTNEDGTCSTLYLVESYYNSSKAYLIPLESGSDYSKFGSLNFNQNENSLSYMGYMYNTVYPHVALSFAGKTYNYKFASGFTYANGTYTLSGNLINVYDLSDSTTTKMNNAHYTCFDTTGKCTKLIYVFYANIATVRLINLENGKSIEDAVNEMLYSDDVNTKNSTIKTGVDAWFKHYLLDYSDYLEDTIFCNDRSQINQSLNGWNPNGGRVNVEMSFYGSSDLSCPNETDKFSVSNNKAKLTYKVGLMTSREMELLNANSARKYGGYYWLGSPYDLSFGTNTYWMVDNDGDVDDSFSYHSNGVRPAISLRPGIEYYSGDGSMNNPYKVLTD